MASGSLFGGAPGGLFGQRSPVRGGLFDPSHRKPVGKPFGAQPNDSPLFTDAHARTYEKRYKLPAGSVAHAYRRTLSGCAVDVLTKLLENRPIVSNEGDIVWSWPSLLATPPEYGQLTSRGLTATLVKGSPVPSQSGVISKFCDPSSSVFGAEQASVTSDNEPIGDINYIGYIDGIDNIEEPISRQPTLLRMIRKWNDNEETAPPRRKSSTFCNNGDGVPAHELTRRIKRRDGLVRVDAKRELHPDAGMFGTAGFSGVHRSKNIKRRSDGMNLRRSNAVRERHNVAGAFGTAGISGIRRRPAVREQHATAGLFGTAGVSGVQRSNAVRENHPTAGMFGTAGVSGVGRSNAVRENHSTAGMFGTAGVSGIGRSNAIRENHSTAGMFGTAGVSGVGRSNAVRRHHDNAGMFGTAGVSGVNRRGAIRKKTNPRKKSASPPETPVGYWTRSRSRDQSQNRSQSKKRRADSMSPMREWWT